MEAAISTLRIAVQDAKRGAESRLQTVEELEAEIEKLNGLLSSAIERHLAAVEWMEEIQTGLELLERNRA